MATGSTVTVKIVGDASSLKAATSEASNSIEGLGDEAKKATGGGGDPLSTIGKKIDFNNLMAASDTIAGVGDKVIGIGKKSIESAANIQAMNSTFTQTFGDELPKANKAIDSLSKAYDILPNRIKPSYQQFTAMFKGLGLSTSDAADKATQAMRISANAAAFYDKSLEDSNSALQSFVKGNYEGGESIGLFANDTQMAAYAIKNNMIPATEGAKEASEKLLISQEKAQRALDTAIQKHGENSLEARDAALKLKSVQGQIDEELGPQAQKWADLDEATKQAVRLDYAENMLVQAGAIDEVGKMTGQASRESGEYENQIGNMQQAIEDFYAVIGEDILPIFLGVLQKGVEILSTLAGWFSNLPEPVKTFIFVLGGLLAVFSQLAPIITAVIAVMGALSGVALAPIIAVVGGVVLAVTAAIEIFKNWGAITDWISEKWTAFTTWAGELWEGFKETLANIWSGVKETASTIWEDTKTTVGTIWDSMKQKGSETWDNITKTASESWETFKQVNGMMWNVIKDTSVTIWTSMKDIAGKTWEAMKNAVSSAWNAIKDVTSNVFNAVKNVASTIWNGIKQVISSVVDWIKGKVADGWADLQNRTSSIFNGIKNVASTVWNAIKDTITRPVEAAKNTVANIVEKIKGLFNFRLKFPSIEIPHIPLPHFRISGSFNPLKGQIPSVGVNWYAKGGLFSSPSIIGVGEAGDEAVLPLKDKVLGRIASMINSNMPQGSEREIYNERPVINQITVEWTGDVDSPDRINELTNVIVEKITDNNKGAFA